MIPYLGFNSFGQFSPLYGPGLIGELAPPQTEVYMYCGSLKKVKIGRISALLQKGTIIVPQRALFYGPSNGAQSSPAEFYRMLLNDKPKTLSSFYVY